jgi:HlyD family secretion protein
LNMPGKLASISPMTEQSFEWPPTRSFRGYGQLAHRDPRLRPGMNGSMNVVESRIPNAISIPAKALFTQKGKPVVYLVAKNSYHMKEVQVLARNADEIAIRGISAGFMVALAEPQTQEHKK